jgi:hypothetical protein
MKNVNTKRKTESDTRIFNDWLSTVGKYRNPRETSERMNFNVIDKKQLT